VPVLDDETRRAIDVHLPSYGTSQNPIDSTAQGVHKLGYAAFAQMAARSPLIDSVIVVVTARRSTFLEGDLEKLKALRAESRKPVLMWTYTLPSERSVEIINEAQYPLFTGAPGCARTLRALVNYRRVREAFLQNPQQAVSAHPAHDNVRAKLSGASGVLTEWQARPLLAAYGIGGGDFGKLVHSADEAASAARQIGKPLALKVQSPDIPHKTEAGAVVLNVKPDAAGEVYARVLAGAKSFAPHAQIEGVLVQPMLAQGREMLVGITRDQRWGPMLMVGFGGVLVEVLKDVALAPLPLDKDAALALLNGLNGAAILQEHRGRPAADLDALAELMVRLSQFTGDHAGLIAEIDLNPVIVHPRGQGVSLADALIVTRREDAHVRAAE
jgi:acyl-CoA synthetase (NDP forming)